MPYVSYLTIFKLSQKWMIVWSNQAGKTSLKSLVTVMTSSKMDLQLTWATTTKQTSE